MISDIKIPRTAIEVFRMLPEGTRVEVLNGALHMCEPTSLSHQRTISDLLLAISQGIGKRDIGDLVLGPLDVYLEDQDSAVQPDILFISNSNKHIIKDDGYVHGTPNLIIEILLKDKRRDKVVKKGIYEKAGVKEYFIIDPKTKMTEAYLLKNKKYERQYSKKKYFQSSLLKLEFTF